MFKVLVIDSSAEDAELLRGLLAEEGAQVVVCRDGTVARPVIDGHADGFRAVFMLWDVADPAFAETLALLRHRWPETPVVVMIEEFTYDLAARAFGLGAKGVLQKPVEAKNLKACLRELPPARDHSSPMMVKLREKIHGESASLLAELWQLTRVIPHADSNVLLLGESGTGKELFARAIHELGPRPDAPFVAAQVSATHHNLPEEVRHKKFRLDLYQRINEATIHAPPLRERKGDIEVLARYFLRLHSGERQTAFADETLKILCGYPFPGNGRELENIVKSALRACVGEIILPQSLPMRIMNDLLRDPPVTTSDNETEAPNLDHIEELMDELARSLPADWLTTAYREAARSYNQAFDRVYLRKMLEHHKHNLKAAAKASDLDPKTFRNRWKQSGLPPIGG